MQVGNFDKSKLKSKSKMAIYHFQLKRLVEVMEDQPLLVLHIVQVKNWYAISMERNKTTQKKPVSNLQKSMHPKIQILSYSTVRHFGTK